MLGLRDGGADEARVGHIRLVQALTGAGVVLVLVAAALPGARAAAPSTIDSPDPNTTVSAHGEVSAAATVRKDPGDATPVALVLADPRTSSDSCHSRELAATTSGGTTQLTGKLDTEDAYPASCGGFAGIAAFNGTWTLTLTGDPGNASRTFVLKVPPKAPAHLAVRLLGPSSVRATWDASAEPDVDAYTVTVDDGPPAQRSVANVCANSSCEVDLPISGYGSHSVTVGALRWTSYSDHTHLAAVTSSASFTSASPQPSPVPAPTSDGAARTTSAAKSSPTRADRTYVFTPGSTLGPLDRKGFAQAFRNFAPVAAAGALPTRGARGSGSPAPGSEPAVDPNKPTEDGTYGTLSGYPGTRTQTEQAVRRIDVPLSSVAEAIGVTPQTFWNSMAGGALFVLGFGHLRFWLRRRPTWE
jgi:hypothetical protein